MIARSMRKGLLVLAAATLSVGTSPALAEMLSFKADIQAIAGTNSKASGTLTAEYDTSSKKLTWHGTYKGIGTYALYTYVDGGLVFFISDGVNAPFLSPDAGTGIWDGGWHVVVGTYDGSTVRLYVDGRQVGTGTQSTITIQYGLPDSNQFAIGDYLGPCPTPLGFVGDMLGVAVTQSVTPSPFG